MDLIGGVVDVVVVVVASSGEIEDRGRSRMERRSGVRSR